MGYGFSFGEPTVHLESMCGSSTSDPSRFLDGIGSCTLFDACGRPSSEQSKKTSGDGGIGRIGDLTEPDAACFSEEKAGPIKEIALENAVTGTDATCLMKEKMVFRSQAASSCTEINSAMLSAKRNDLVELPSVVSPEGKEELLPPLVNGCDISIDYSEDYSAKKGFEVTRISKGDVGLADAFGSHLSTWGCTGLGLETPGVNMDGSANVCNGVDTMVSKEKVGQIVGAGLEPPGLVSPCVKGANKEECSQMEGENANTGEIHCNEERVPLVKMPKEREVKPKPSELIVFTRRNPKRSATHAESDLNIDRLTRISNRGRKSRKDKEIFDPELLATLIRDPNLTTKKRKPSNRRVSNSVWGQINHLSQILDLSFGHFKLKQEKEAEEKKKNIALGEKLDGKNIISDQFVTDIRHFKQEGIFDRDFDSTLTHERSSVGHEIVKRATNQGETTDPGSSPDSVVYNPVSCEANPVLLQCKQSTKSKKKKKNKGENAKPGKRSGLLNVSGSTNQRTRYWFQIDKKRKPISDGKKEDKAQELNAPGVAKKEMGNTSDPYNGVTIASHSESIASNGTQEPFRYERYMEQPLPAAKALVPVPPGSVSVPTQSVLIPSDSTPMPGQPVMVPELPRQPLPVHMQPISSSLRPFYVPPNPAAASEKLMQVKAHLPVRAPVQLKHAPAQPVPITAKPVPKPRVAWVCCDECGKWRCIPAELADVIDETNCRWTCKDNANKAFSECSIPQEKSNAEINAELEISDASGDEGPSGRENGSGDVNHMKSLAGDMRSYSTKSAKKALGPAPYTPLKMNLFLHRNRRTQTIDEIMVCNCKPPENGGVGCRSQCLNRILSIECIRGMCPCGDLCSNQQFQRRNYAKLMYFRSGKKGYGLQLLEDVPAGRFLIEYVGEVLDMASYEARQKEYASRGQKHFYFMTLNGGEVIDACAKGNLGRFINHSCDPNCRTEKWIVNGEVCIGLFAIRGIKKGDELTFDYNYVRVVGAAAKKCFCGAASCRGYIGGDPSSTDLVVQEDSDEEDYFEQVTAKQQERKEPIRKAPIATLSDKSLKKHPVPDNSQDKFCLSTPFVHKDSSVEVHKLGYREHVMGCKPDIVISQLANSLANGPMDNSQRVFGLLPPENFSQSVIHPEISLGVSNSKNRENSRKHKTDMLSKPSDSQGASGSVNGGALSRAIISAGNYLEISKSEYRDDIAQCKPDSMLSLPTKSHEVSELLDKEADKDGDLKDVSCPSSSSIAVSSYSLLKLHLSRVKSLGEFKMGDRDGSSRPLSPGTSFPNNSVNEYKPVEKESLLEGLSEKSLQKSVLVDREKICQPPQEDDIQDNKFPYDICAANREADDVSTPVLPDHSIEEQEPADIDMDNLCESQCMPVSPSDGYAPVLLPAPEHHNLPNEDIPSEEDATRTPVHVTRYLSDRVHSRQSGGMGADKTSSKASSYKKPTDSFDVQPEQVDLCLNKVDQQDRPLSPSVCISGMKTVNTDATDEGAVICQEVKEMVHNTATLDFEGVEEKLNELLDQDGSISRRRHATKGYLKLLIVTAAAGDTGTSQRLKDLSLILDALLKTKSYTVLMDIMKKNGLQMLHTILKQNRDDFNRIPIIRKLLKVLGHLGDMDILTVEQMNQGPPRPGMESFRESIYKLTKHENNKVNQIAREFFNRWMPKSMRVHNSFAHTCNPSTSSKHKSRWDHLSDSHTQDPNFASCNSQAQEVERSSKRPCLKSFEEDAPPGFEPVGPPPGFGPASPPGFESVSPPGFGSVMQPALGSVSDGSPVQVVWGYRQEKYRPGISVSYGIPAVTAQNLGVFVPSEGRLFWGIAPGIPFQPFPPLPPYPIVGDVEVENNGGPGFCNDRSRRRWGSNLRNQRRFSRPSNNNEYACDNRRRFSRSGKDWPKWPRDRR